MKRMKKVFAFLLTMVMVLAMAVPAMAAGTGTITITPPTDTEAGVSTTYSVYKVFDADGNGTNISYKLPSEKTLTGDIATYFAVDEAGNVTVKDAAKDAAGNLTSDAIAAIAAFVQGDTAVTTVITTGTTAGTATGLANGYYYITTTTGSAVTVTSTNPNASVNDKNSVPELKKTILSVKDGEVIAGSIDSDGKNALAQLNSKVSYQVTIKLDGKTTNVKFHDTMGNGLTYNNDAAVTGVSGYKIETTPDTGDTLTISFEDGITGTATITYSATVNSDALTVNTGKNTAKVSYGSSNGTTGDSTNVYNAKFTVTKKDGEGNALAGAGFVIKNTDGKYYQKSGNDINWVDSIDDATEYTSDAQGAVTAFTGLANGTYTLVEKTVPAGYNKAADSTFTVAENDYADANLAQTSTVVNNAGSELPSTGGIGTTLFYVIGAICVLGAGVLLVTRRRMASK